MNLLKAHFVVYLTFGIIYLLFSDIFNPFPRSVIGIDFFLSLFLLGGLRISKRLIIEQSYHKEINPSIIVGVNVKTTSVIKSSLEGAIPYFPVAIIPVLEKNRSAIHTFINNVKVYDDAELESLVQRENIKTAIVVADVTPQELNQIFKRLKDAGIEEIKISRVLGSREEKLEDLSIEDLLARHPKDLDTRQIASFVKDKSVLITGAGGSIGSEIALQCHSYGASRLILVDNAEYNLYSIGEKLPEATLSLISVIDKKALEKLFEDHGVIDIVIHAAAYKHVPLCEANIEAALINNVLGSQNVIDLCIEKEVKKLVIISTDKAVRPTNVMGATKRVTELYAQNVKSKKTEIVAVRFGNVLGSSGSVIPKFKRQIEEGGPVTVTHPDMTRYFMMIPEACQLVLQAASIAKGNELFILDMGEPVKIVDLAKQMIRLYGKEDEIEIRFVGLRPGEKMYEELLISDAEKKTEYASIFITNPSVYEIEQLKEDMAVLLKTNAPLKQLKKIVPEFSHTI